MSDTQEVKESKGLDRMFDYYTEVMDKKNQEMMTLIDEKYDLKAQIIELECKLDSANFEISGLKELLHVKQASIDSYIKQD